VGTSLLLPRAQEADASTGPRWAELGCSVLVAEMADARALTAAFEDADGVFVPLPPNFDPSPGFPDVRTMLDGFNEGWIEFESGEAGSVKGPTTLESVLKKLIA
jgi:hypothetical protein